MSTEEKSVSGEVSGGGESVKGNEEKAEVPPLIQLVNANDISGAERLLVCGGASVHDRDNTGMTALMHSAYKGLAQMCKMLIKQGSDVNYDGHSHAYSPLHFAALSSSLPTTQLLLDCGAKTYKTNTLGRTAAQMAGFVGHSGCVALINNHVNKSELRRFTHPTSEHQMTRLNPEAEQPLYDYIMQINLHPVYLSLRVGRSPTLLPHLHEASTVLQHLSVAETKRTSNVNEVLSLKFHYLGCLLNHLAKEQDKYNESHQGEEDEKEKGSTEQDFPRSLEPCLKQFLRCRSSDGAEVLQELWLRDAIKAFHCVEMPLFLQVVRSLNSSEVTALSVLNGAINGQRGLPSDEDSSCCAACSNQSTNSKACSKCKVTRYCDRFCQKIHWSSHKKFCEKLSKNLPSSTTSTNTTTTATTTNGDYTNNNETSRDATQDLANKASSLTVGE